jgi:NAD(P)H-hydrate epimerase
MVITTSITDSVAPFFQGFSLPGARSHKGQNGKVMIIGGSALFHSAVIWSAEAASHFADMVHFSSTSENNEIVKDIKKKWRNGIVVPQSDIPSYITEDDAVLLGTGMMRGRKPVNAARVTDYESILRTADESERTYLLTRYLLNSFPSKKWVIDAGSLQMMERDWLKRLETKPILTPHQKEFATLFGTDPAGLSRESTVAAVKKAAQEHGCVILLKAGYDIVSDGNATHVIEGGNAGLTKGGTGDILAGLAASFYARHNALDSAVLSSFLLKKTADRLFLRKGFWYNNSDILGALPDVLYEIVKSIPGLTDP